MQAYRLRRTGEKARPVIEAVAVDEPGAGFVRLRMEAASLNFRDLLILDSVAQGSGRDGLVPLSDGVGRVESTGTGTSLAIGARVACCFFRDWLTGPFKSEYLASALGGTGTDGVLAETIVVPESAVIAIPDYLTSIEAATLPCAAVTAWQALFVRGGIAEGDHVLIQGTGGVALFALQIAKAFGAKTIVLSSSEEKCAAATAVGATSTVNYTTTPEWDVEVLAKTGDRGVDHVLELGGPDTFERSLKSLAPGGRIAQIGVLTGIGPKPNLARLQNINASINGITVGSRNHFDSFLEFYSAKNLRPVIDAVFPYAEVTKAYAALKGSHFGKIVIDLRAKT